MSDNRTPDEIERELEQNRDGLQNTLSELQDTFSPDAIVRTITDNVGSQGGEFGKSIALAARENPLALAVTGVGLGWLIFGRGPSTDRIEESARRARADHHSDDYDFDDDFSPAGGRTNAYGGGRRTAYGEGADAHIGTRGPVPAGEGPNWYSDSHGPTLGQRMRAGMHNARSGASSTAGRFRDGSSEMAGRVREGSSEMAGRVRDRSSDMARRLSEGTEHMSEEARERIMAARERAILANEQASRGMRRGADKATDFFEEHPLVAGALAFAVGAAIAGGLPRSRYEDEHFGEESDRLYHEAERVYAEERAKVERVAGAAFNEAKSVGEEVRQDADKATREMKDKADNETRGEGSAADAAVDRTEDAVSRVAGAAQEQAKKENLGGGSND
ncbi:DUF3618 domain-containing protein [Palleronia sp.]|uniref:DUF3618 domain-containing protein n=1 Tax=Palleronia sp. TaxID=1940284 RepID=UPI0035C85E1A